MLNKAILFLVAIIIFVLYSTHFRQQIYPSVESFGVWISAFVLGVCLPYVRRPSTKQLIKSKEHNENRFLNRIAAAARRIRYGLLFLLQTIMFRWRALWLLLVNLCLYGIYSYREHFWENLFVACHNFTRMDVCFPNESLFYSQPLQPNPAFYLVGFFVIFLVIVGVIKWIGKNYPKLKLPQTSNAIATLGVIVTVLVAFIPYLVLIPILDYDVQKIEMHGNHVQLNISIINYGLAAAKDVIFSIENNTSNVKFLNITSQPIQELVKNNQTNNPFFEIAALPPGADTTTKTEMQVVGHISPILTVYVRSEETVGYHGLVYIAMVYLAALLAALIPIILWLRGLLTKKEQTRLKKMETEINEYEKWRLSRDEERADQT